MLQNFNIPAWKAMPFIRLLPPFFLGIILQWYLQFSPEVIMVSVVCFTSILFLFRLLPLSLRYNFRPIQGLILHLVIISFGLLMVWQKDIRHRQNWYGKYYNDSNYIVATIAEPLIEKDRSYKSDANVEELINSDKATSCTGKIILYFAKDSLPNKLQYGDKLLINKKLQEIKNSGNPGAFNYQRYAAFQQTFHTIYLKNTDWVLVPEKKVNIFRQFIFSAREKTLNILQQHFGRNKNELGIAEALLIGYTNDLDKDLVQAYSNTGVVHIIAISGMHLALIYVMLAWLFARMPLVKRSKVLQLILVLSCLWLFALLTGGSASVLRSAVMFSFIKFGQTFFKRSSIQNSLAASAFVLLCYNPYYLWDVGFQLSYLAVISIIAFQKPIYRRLDIKNKWLDKIWEMAAVTIAAQILTFPICIYYFHQFPVLFLITNLVAVPLSTIILYGEILLMIVSWIPFAGEYVGKLVNGLLWLMNQFVTWINKLPFAVWDRISANVLSTWLLYGIIIALAVWLMKKQKPYFKMALLGALLFTITQVYGKWQVSNQQKLIVYNVSKYKAVDIIEGNNYQFIGDSVMLVDGVLQNFHLKPARIALQLNERVDSLENVMMQQNFMIAGNKRIFFVDSSFHFNPLIKKIDLDVIIISKNPKINIEQLANTFNCKQYVFDASNSLYRVNKWKSECDSLHLLYYTAADNGAFIYDLNH